MDLTNRQQLIKYLQSHGLYTKKKLGQNFLVDRGVLNKIVAAAELSSDDCVIEVGPGLGVLTEELVKRAGKVVAVELDTVLAKLLGERFSNNVISSEARNPIAPGDYGVPQDDTYDRGQLIQHINNLTIVNSSILAVNIPELTKDCSSYKVVANIPYYITSKILRLFLEAEKKPETIVLLTQKEVAERICASPRLSSQGDGRVKPGDMSVLSVSVQYYGQPEIAGVVSRNSFFPAPEVDSAILKISDICSPRHSDRPESLPRAERSGVERRAEESYERPLDFARDDKEKNELEEKDFFRCVKHGFASRRKTLLNNLSAGFHLEKSQVLDILDKVGLNDKSRAQELSVEKWGELCRQVSKIASKQDT